MPDWFYRTVSQPLLFRVAAPVARRFALGVVGNLARLPLGPQAIDFLGHMAPPRQLAREFCGLKFLSPVGLGPWLDGEAQATKALSRFGFGFLEVGPVAKQSDKNSDVGRDVAQQSIYFPHTANISLATLQARLQECAHLKAPILVRLGLNQSLQAEEITHDFQEIIRSLSPHTSAFSLPTLHLALEHNWTQSVWLQHLQEVL